MELFVKEYTDCLRQAFAVFNESEVKAEYESTLAQMQKKTTFPGYRAGKVPFDIIEKNSADELMRLVVNGMVLKAAQKLQADGVRLFSEPRFKPLSNLSRGKPFSFSIVFDTMPRVLKNIDPEKTVVDFEEYYYDDRMMDESIRRDFKVLEEVSGRIEEGDTVTVREKGAGEGGDATQTLDSRVVKKLIGRKAGETLILSYNDLDTSVVEFLGRASGGDTVELEILKAERPKEQDVTDELVSQVSVHKTADDYRKAMKERFENLLKEMNSVSKRNALMEYIAKNAEVEYPKSEYLREFRRENGDFAEKNFAVSEIPLTGLLGEKKIRNEHSALPDKVHANIVFFYCVMNLADRFGIQADAAAVNRIAKAHAREQELSLEEYKQKASPEEWSAVQDRARFDAALAYLVGKVGFQAKGKLPLIQHHD